MTYFDKTILEVQQLRQFYFQAIQNTEIAEKVLNQLSILPFKNNIQIAYEAAFEAFMAKKAWNPYQKLMHVDKAKRTFRKAIKLEESNLEFRFLRFSMNHHLPAFLQDSNIMEEDQNQILRLYAEGNFAGLDKNMLEKITSFLKNTGRFDQETCRLITKRFEEFS
ncbi:MAG: hypothetical protein OHK0038_17870 [Flammeovirgaceae bacterium]